jgi:hypothetical protein
MKLIGFRMWNYAVAAEKNVTLKFTDTDEVYQFAPRFETALRAFRGLKTLAVARRRLAEALVVRATLRLEGPVTVPEGADAIRPMTVRLARGPSRPAVSALGTRALSCGRSRRRTNEQECFTAGRSVSAFTTVPQVWLARSMESPRDHASAQLWSSQDLVDTTPA